MYCSLNAVISVLSQLLDFAHTVPSGQSTHSTPILSSLSPPSQVPVPLSRVTSQSCMHLPCSQVSFYHGPLPTGVLNIGFSVTPSPTPHNSSRAAHVSVTFVVSVSGMGLDPQSVNQSLSAEDSRASCVQDIMLSAIYVIILLLLTITQ